MPENLYHVSLFSGIPLGGFELAMAEAGIRTIAAAEIDKKARGVLHDRFPGVHIYHDVRKVTGDSLRSLGAVPGRPHIHEQRSAASGWTAVQAARQRHRGAHVRVGRQEDRSRRRSHRE